MASGGPRMAGGHGRAAGHGRRATGGGQFGRFDRGYDYADYIEASG
jgi:hypothetical protein